MFYDLKNVHRRFSLMRSQSRCGRKKKNSIYCCTFFDKRTSMVKIDMNRNQAYQN